MSGQLCPAGIRPPRKLTAAAATALLEKLEAARGQEMILVCSPGIAERLIAKFQAESLEELDGRLGVGVLPLFFVEDGRAGVIRKASVERYLYNVVDAASRARLGLKEPPLWPAGK